METEFIATDDAFWQRLHMLGEPTCRFVVEQDGARFPDPDRAFVQVRDGSFRIIEPGKANEFVLGDQLYEVDLRKWNEPLPEATSQ